MSVREIADDMERWADTARGEMTRSATVEREVRGWVDQLRRHAPVDNEPSLTTAQLLAARLSGCVSSAVGRVS